MRATIIAITVFAAAVGVWLGLHVTPSSGAPAPRYEITAAVVDDTGHVVYAAHYTPAGTPLTFENKDACDAFGKDDPDLQTAMTALAVAAQAALPAGTQAKLVIACTPIEDNSI
jgi:hypothetical protein